MNDQGEIVKIDQQVKLEIVTIEHWTHEVYQEPKKRNVVNLFDYSKEILILTIVVSIMITQHYYYKEPEKHEHTIIVY